MGIDTSAFRQIYLKGKNVTKAVFINLCAGHFSDNSPNSFSGISLCDHKRLKNVYDIIEEVRNKFSNGFLTGWTYLAQENEGNVYYRLCFSLSVYDKEIAVYLKMTYPEDVLILSD